MNRLHNKCLIASCGLHGLLAVVLIVAPAFLRSAPKLPDTPSVLEFIPAKLVDAKVPGGQPKPVAPAPAVAAAPPSAAPPPPRVEPTPPSVKKEPVLEKPVEKAALIPAEPKEVKKVPPKNTLDKPKIQIADTSKPTKRNDDSRKRAEQEREARAEQERAAKAQASARADLLRNAVSGLSAAFSSGLRFEPAGPGGEAFANYGQAVITAYQNAWVLPDDVTDDNHIVGVTVTIARDGFVRHASVLKRSGNASVDRSVQNALNRVKFIAPFPNGAKDFERTFNIDFNLKTRRQIG
jgi:TonB family protein